MAARHVMIRIFVAAVLIVVGLLVAGVPAMAASFLVNSNGDGGDSNLADNVCNDGSGQCTLRAAIQQGNNLSGPHTITFSPSVLQITLTTHLPSMQAPFVITGNLPLRTIINGNGVYWCLDLSDATSVLNPSGANGSIISNLVIQNCNSDGISANGHGFVFANNYIGTDITGSTAVANDGHGISVSSSHIYTLGPSILTDIYNLLPEKLQPVDSSQVTQFVADFSGNLVTALAALTQPVMITGNVISGNTGNGIEIFSINLAGVIASGNMIGTNAAGSDAIPNGGSGVHLVGSTFGNLIGPGNVISGNTLHGIHAEPGAVLLPNFVLNNRIGLGTDSSKHVGNGQSGIYADTKPDSNITNPNPTGVSLMIGPGNLISDNQGANNSSPDVMGSDNAGIVITNASSSVSVIGNTIGMGEFPSGTPTASTSYGNAGDGIIVTTSDNTIGGTSSAAGNIIAANARNGIVVRGSGTTGTVIQGNHIGMHPSFMSNFGLGNGGDGVHIDAASSTTMGGTGASDFNVIAANGRNGVALRNGGTNNGWANLMQRNLIYHNATATPGVSIDLEHTKNTADDPGHTEYPSNYANLDQVQPVICTGAPGEPSACSGYQTPVYAAGNTTLDWTIATHGPADFRLEFFKVNAATVDSATSITYIGEATVSTDALGLPAGAGCTAGRCTSVIAANTAGGYIVMTATDVTQILSTPNSGWFSLVKCFVGNQGIVLPNCNVNNTSEYSNVVTVAAAAPAATTDAASAITATAATLNGTVSSNGATTAVTFEYGSDVSYGSSATATPGSLAANETGTAVSASISGLSCNKTYHFRASATNSAGTVNGDDVSFTTGACPPGAPTALTTAATAIDVTGATLNGTVSSNGAATTVTFEYGATITYGSSVSATPGSLASGAVNTDVAAPITGLACNSTYHFRVVATNPSGTTTGNDLTFTTSACPPGTPSATTDAAGSISASGATLTGTVSSNGASTTVTFDYGLTAAYGGSVTATQSALAGSANNAAVSAPVSGLNCNTTYHFRVVATNVSGTANGLDQIFVTGACPPTAATTAASAIAVSGATLNGTVSSNGGSTAVAFEYGLTNTYGSTTAATQSPLAGSASGAAVSAPATGLNCNTTYHFRVTATNASGTSNGNDLTFTTGACPPSAPAAASGPASAIGASSATLNGTVSSNNASTTVIFEYGATNTYGSTVNATQSPLSLSAANAAVSAPVTGLSCNSTYHFRVVAANTAGTTNGLDQTFTTAACPAGSPTAATVAADAITATGATLNGTVSSNGASTTVTFEYGATITYGSTVNATQSPLAAGATTAAVSAPLTGLSCNSTYHFRVKTTNISGTANGGDMSFKTSACVTTTAVTVVKPLGSGNTTAGGSSVYGQPVDVTVTVTAGSGGSAPDGSVTVSAGGSSCVATLGSPVGAAASGSCTLAPQLAASTSAYSVGANYTGSAVFSASTSSGTGNGSLIVIKGSTKPAITSHLPKPSDVGSPITVFVSLSVTAPAAGTPSGTIKVSDGSASCTITLPSTSCNLTPTTSGVKTLTASYSGDANFKASTSTGVSHTVNISANSRILTVEKAGTGYGTVQGSGIDCGGTCSGVYDVGKSVTLSATPSKYSAFTGWSGPCTGTASCTVKMDATKSVTATFELVDAFAPIKNIYAEAFDGASAPVLAMTPEAAGPIGLGTAADGGDTLSLRVGLKAFAEPVDLYVLIDAPSLDPVNAYLLHADGSWKALSAGLAPWKKNISAPVDEALLGDFPVASLTPGTYDVYVMATPTGTRNTYYLWQTSLSVGSESTLPLPSGGLLLATSPAAFPVMSIDPEIAGPISLGSLAVDGKTVKLSTTPSAGDTLSFGIGLEAFSGPVDLYVGLYAPAIDPLNIYLVKPDGTVQALSAGLVPYKNNVVGPVQEKIWGDIPASMLPAGSYSLYLMTTPAGNIDSFYLWTNEFTIP